MNSKNVDVKVDVKKKTEVLSDEEVLERIAEKRCILLQRNGITKKSLEKMKDDDIEKLFGSIDEELFGIMNEEFKLIYQKEQERKKEIAEKRSMTLLRNEIAKYNEVREERRKAMEGRSFGGELYAHYLYLHCITNH